MPKLPVYSGKKVVKILCSKFGFTTHSQKGSHFKLKKNLDNETISVIVPNHYEVAQGTMQNILRQAKIDANRYLEAI